MMTTLEQTVSGPVHLITTEEWPTFRIYKVSLPHGRAYCTYDANSGCFKIDDLEVDVDPTFRRQGTGTRLVEEARTLAGFLGARSIYASIVSREAVDTFTKVFGEDAIRIARLGTYSQPYEDSPYDALATLEVEVIH